MYWALLESSGGAASALALPALLQPSRQSSKALYHLNPGENEAVICGDHCGFGFLTCLPTVYANVWAFIGRLEI